MSSEPYKRRSRRPWLAVLLAILALAVYGNNLRGPFILDDVPWILYNQNIRTLRPWWKPVAHTSRPVVQWSLAANYAMGGLNPLGYHIVNDVLHALAALALFGVARRTLRTERLAARFGGAADGLAFAVALLWALHPLGTEAVTYVIQRAESMAGLFAILTLYCVIRGAATARASAWNFLAIVCSALAMGSKPVAVIVPLLVLAYDWIFLAGTGSELWRKRRGLYIGLGACWLLAVVLLFVGGNEWIGSAGVVYGGRAISWLDYAALEPGVILHYLRLSLWPDGLCLLYGRPQQSTGLLFWAQCGVIGILLVATVWLVARKNAVGFLGAWFFLTLAPTSSVIPLLHPVVEHRMYVPLMAVMAGIVVAVRVAIDKIAGSSEAGKRVSVAVLVLAAVGIGAVTIERNRDYRTEVSIWQDTAQKAPLNADARYGLGLAWATARQIDEAGAAFGEAMRLKPDFKEVEYDWGVSLVRAGREEEALTHFAAALRIDPRYGKAEDGIGFVLYRQGKLAEAIPHFFQATRLNPNDVQAQYNLSRAVYEVRQRSMIQN
jgi:tetratricopeptide (TPR) repeat protein